MALEIGGILRQLLPVLVAAPLEIPGEHVLAIAHAKDLRALGAILEFMQLAGRMDDEQSGRDVDDALRRAHTAPAAEPEIDFGCLRMTMIRADLARLPVDNREIAIGDLAQDLFFLGMHITAERLLFLDIEHL